MKNFFEALNLQRRDDHRYYHLSRINQSLHFISAMSFIFAYAMLFADPAVAALIGWLVSMTTRQSGHFFFEPQGYDEVNHVTNEYKEAIKVGYNLRRKVVLLSVWIASPLLLLIDPGLFGLLNGDADFIHNVGLMWLGLATIGLVFRTIQLFFIRDMQTGLVWLAKILTDPFHDITLYWNAPLHLLRGELYEQPKTGVQH